MDGGAPPGSDVIFQHATVPDESMKIRADDMSVNVMVKAITSQSRDQWPDISGAISMVAAAGS